MNKNLLIANNTPIAATAISIESIDKCSTTICLAIASIITSMTSSSLCLIRSFTNSIPTDTTRRSLSKLLNSSVVIFVKPPSVIRPRQILISIPAATITIIIAARTSTKDDTFVISISNFDLTCL